MTPSRTPKALHAAAPRSGAGLRWSPLPLLCQAQCLPRLRETAVTIRDKHATSQQSSPAPEVCPSDRAKSEEGEDILALRSKRATWKGCPWEYIFSWLQPEFIWLPDKPSDRGKRAHLWNFCEAEIFTANTVFKYLTFQSSENCCKRQA